MQLEVFRESIHRLAPANSEGCWIWTRYVDPAGYGRVRIADRAAQGAHRISYSTFVGPIPTDLTVDHLCFVRRCVNPAHLRLVTWQQNLRNQRSSFKPRCINGHSFDAANTYIRPSGGRDCRTCIRDRVTRYRAKEQGGMTTRHDDPEARPVVAELGSGCAA